MECSRFKFRVWDNKHNDYLPKSDVRLDGRTGKIERASFFDDPYTIEQCTGICDNNGKLIYEGDVVKTKEYGKEDASGRCNFPGYDTFTVIHKDCSFWIDNDSRCFYLSERSKVEIIGNIHESKENT